MSARCETCKQTMESHQLRPYGAGGSLICFQCAMASPVSKREAERRIEAALSQGGPLTLTDTGIRQSTEAEIELAAAVLSGKKLNA